MPDPRGNPAITVAVLAVVAIVAAVLMIWLSHRSHTPAAQGAPSVAGDAARTGGPAHS